MIKPQKVIDSHIHVFDLSRFRVLWLDNEPTLNCNNTLVEYSLASQVHPAEYTVAGVVHVELDTTPEQKRAENDYFAAEATAGNTLIKAAVLHANMRDPDLRAFLEPYAQQSGVKGVRHLLHVDNELSGACLEPQFVESVRMLSELGLHFEGCLRSSDLSDFHALAQQCPQTYFVLNHMGLPDVAAWQDPTRKAEVEQWNEDIRKLASLPNMCCKISGLGSANPDIIRPLIDWCVAQFKPERLIFASNFPVCNLQVTFDDWIRGVMACLQGLSQDDNDRIFYKNAMRIYGIEGV